MFKVISLVIAPEIKLNYANSIVSGIPFSGSGSWFGAF
jgi:hypothetical protein